MRPMLAPPKIKSRFEGVVNLVHLGSEGAEYMIDTGSIFHQICIFSTAVTKWERALPAILLRKSGEIGTLTEEMPGIRVAVCFKGRVKATSMTSSSALVILKHQVFGMNRSLYDKPSVYVEDASP
jgi:hypothetical protein